MNRTVNITQQAQREVLKSGTYQATLYAIVDLGTQRSEKFATRSRKIRLSFEIPSEMREFKKDAGLQPITLHKEYTLSFSDKSNLRKDLLWRTNSGFKDGEKSFDLDSLIGKNCLLSVQVAKNAKGIEYNIISGISWLPVGMKEQPLINKPYTYQIDQWQNEVFDSLPQFLKEKILKAGENSSQAEIDARQSEHFPF